MNELDVDRTAGIVEILGAAVFSSGAGGTADISAPPSAKGWRLSVGQQGATEFVNKLGVGHAPRFVERTGMPVVGIVTGAAVHTGAPSFVMCAIVV